MKKIFILKGVSNTGKTTKINRIANWLITSYSLENTINFNSTDLTQDTHGVLIINKLKIGINSAGDALQCVKRIDEIKSDCDIIICSCRTKGVTHQHLRNNFNGRTDWLDVYIHCKSYDSKDKTNQEERDERIIKELKGWLIGIEKL